MRVIIFLLSFFVFYNISAQSTKLIDRYLHFGAGYIASTSSAALCYKFNINKSVEIGVGVGALAGVGKEIRDQIVYRGFDPFDFAFTVAGSFWGGFAIHTVIEKNKSIKKPIEF